MKYYNCKTETMNVIVSLENHFNIEFDDDKPTRKYIIVIDGIKYTITFDGRRFRGNVSRSVLFQINAGYTAGENWSIKKF